MALLIRKAWKSESFKKKLVAAPKAVIEGELGYQFPEDFKIKVLELEPGTGYLILPPGPRSAEDEEALAEADPDGARQLLYLFQGALMDEQVGGVRVYVQLEGRKFMTLSGWCGHVAFSRSG